MGSPRCAQLGQWWQCWWWCGWGWRWQWWCGWQGWISFSPAWSSFPEPGRLSLSGQHSPVSEIILLCQKAMMIKMMLKEWKSGSIFKLSVVGNYVGLIGLCQETHKGFPKHTSIWTAKTFLQEHISICSDWFWPGQPGPPVGLNAFLIDSSFLGRRLPS